MRRHYSLTLIAVLALVACLATPAYSQILYGSILGTVEDPTGAVIPKAKVTITNKGTGAVREAETDEAGRYSLLSLTAGSYEMKVAAAGFRTAVRSDVEVTINTVTRADIKLEVGQMSEQVTVSATAVALQTDKSDVKHEISAQMATNLPLQTYRNYQSLIAFVPGATPPAEQNAVVDTPGRALTSNINGTARNNNNTLTDGAANVNIWLPHHVAYVQPVESLETVNITTNSFDAEQGMAGGAAITLTTKSGTNDLHGTGWWFHNDQHLNSDPVYFRPVGYKKPLDILNIFGGNIGGPIKKDKLFYFFNYERTTRRQGSFGSYSVAPADFRAGNFSAWTPYSVVYDPASAPANNASARTPFPNNIVPQNRWNPIFPNIAKDIPLPNQVSVTDPLNLSGNYGKSGKLSLNRNQYDVKGNYNITPSLVTWGKYSRMDAPVSGTYVFGDLGGPALGTEGFGDTTTQLVTGGFTKTISPTFLFDGVFGYTRMDQVVGIPNVDKNIGLDVWKIPGTNGGKQYASDPRYGGAPQVDGFGFTYVGVGATWAPVWRKERSYTFTTNFTKLKGAHEMRWGFTWIRMELNHWQPETANPRGYVAFGAGTTYNQSDTKRGAANSYAAALMGLVNNYSKSIQYYEMKTRENQLGFYFRDRWQVNRNLTLNLGLRYEYYPLINRGDRGIERWDPATNIVYFGGLGGTPWNNGIEVSKSLFAPRIGLAYRIADSWVIRAGYGLTYDPLPFGRPLRGLYPATLTGSWVPSVSTFGWYNTVDQGIPDIPTPDTSKGSAFLPLNIDMGPRSPWGGMLHRGYIQSWNLTVERKLPWEMLASAGYVATRTIHQMLDRNINTVGPGLGTSTANLPLAKLYGRTIGASMWDGFGYGAYDSLQATLQKNFTNGLFLRASYTFGKALNMSDDDGWAGLRLWNWEPMMKRNYGPAGYDRSQQFTMAWNYELPVGKGKKWSIDNTALDLVAGGWKLAGGFVKYTGTPFYVSGSGSSLQCTGCTQTADLLKPVTKIGNKGPGQLYYDPMSFRDPQFEFATTGVYRPGTTGWGILRGPGFWMINPALYKNFRIKEKVNAEFRVESTRFTNTPNWGNPNAGSASMRLKPDGTLDTSLANPLQNFMSITGASTGRVIQFGLRLAF
ncbi:MAG: TonB-dependent receptor [Acidobacteria bacterium]|nr:TonB-dependent receptor [Acidobacteriota bacterium]